MTEPHVPPPPEAPPEDDSASEPAEGPEPLEPVVEIRSFPDVMMAEVVRAQLVASGVPAALKDQHMVGVNPLLGVAVGGVKVVVSAGDAERAAEILALPIGPGSEAFRVEQSATAIYILLGALGGSIPGAVLKSFFGTIFFVLACVAGAFVGGVLGRRKQAYCSRCSASLPNESSRCPGCGAELVGVLEDPEDRLAAEERRMPTER